MILQSLVSLYERDGTMAPFGFEAHPFMWAVVLDEKGGFPTLEDERIDGKAIPLTVPAWPSNRTSKIIPSFLTDPAQYILGLDEDRTAQWVAFNRRLLDTANDPRMVAVRRWLEGWTAAVGAALAETHGVEWGQPVAIKIGDEYAHEVAEARELWSGYLAGNAGQPDLCLITGQVAPIATTHGTLVLGESGKLVSFDGDSTALRHWGYEGNDNAPISERASHAYVSSLKSLKERGQIAFLAGLNIAFWTEATGTVGRAWASELEAAFSGNAAPTRESSTRELEEAIEALRRGQLPPDATAQDAYHVLAIAPGKGRHSIRWQLHSTLGQYCDHVRQHAQDLGLERPPPISSLLRTCRHEKAKTPAPIALAMVKAILVGSAYPTSLASGVLGRLRVGEEPTWLHAAILRSWLKRNGKIKEETMTTSHAYRLGQVLRVVESMQLHGNPNVAVTVRGRLWGLLTTRPAAGLDRLMGSVDTYKTAMRRSGVAGLAEWHDNRIAELLTGLELPSTMSEADRAQMALGYYAERGRRSATPESNTANA